MRGETRRIEKRICVTNQRPVRFVNKFLWPARLELIVMLWNARGVVEVLSQDVGTSENPNPTRKRIPMPTAQEKPVPFAPAVEPLSHTTQSSVQKRISHPTNVLLRHSTLANLYHTADMQSKTNHGGARITRKAKRLHLLISNTALTQPGSRYANVW